MIQKSVNLIITLFTLIMTTNMYAQETELNPMDTLTSHVAGIRQELDVLKRLKITGYIQAQYLFIDSSGQSSAGFPVALDKKAMIRRGRVKFQYDSPFNDKGWSTSQFVLQLDATEKGVNIKDAYVKITDPCIGWFSFTAGLFNRPFGFEIGYSSSQRESPERGRMSTTIFPNERDLGGSLTIQGPKTSNWNWLKLEAGLFNGTGGPSALAEAEEFDKKKDFIGHLSATRSSNSEKIKYGFGVSYYDGGFRIDTNNVYEVATDPNGVKGFKMISKKNVDTHYGSADYTHRQYYGADLQVSIDWMLGITTVRAEYIEGTQPGFIDNSTSPSAIITKNIYNRKFNGAYFYFVQGIFQTPFQLVVKYDWYDPNTEVSGDDIGKAVTSPVALPFNTTDLRYDTYGFGMAYRWDANMKITAYYDVVKNETSKSIPDVVNSPVYSKDLNDNLFTLRLQFKF